MSRRDIWEEKYAPKTLAELIMPSRLKEYFTEQVTNRNIKSSIFYGPPGTGKTTTSKLLPALVGSERLYLNAAEHNGVDFIRNTVEPFATNMGYGSESTGRIIIIDEADSLSLSAINMLKHVYDKSVKFGCRYIFITNHIAKIIDAIDSRCIPINFSMSLNEKREVSKDIILRMRHIFDQENVTYDPKHLNMLIADFAPDFRAITNRAERMTINGVFDYSFYIESKREVYDLIDNVVNRRNYVDLCQWLEDHSYIEHTNLIHQFARELKMLLIDRPPHERGAIAMVEKVLAHYEYQMAFVKNTEISLRSMFYELFEMDLNKLCTITIK